MNYNSPTPISGHVDDPVPHPSIAISLSVVMASPKQPSFGSVEIYHDQALGVGSYGKVCKAKYGQLPCAAKDHSEVYIAGNMISEWAQSYSLLQQLREVVLVCVSCLPVQSCLLKGQRERERRHTTPPPPPVHCQTLFLHTSILTSARVLSTRGSYGAQISFILLLGRAHWRAWY